LPIQVNFANAFSFIFSLGLTASVDEKALINPSLISAQEIKIYIARLLRDGDPNNRDHSQYGDESKEFLAPLSTLTDGKEITYDLKDDKK
jgi:hypothetical protein